MQGDMTAELPGMPSLGEGWLHSYIAKAGTADALRGDVGRGAKWWHALFEGVGRATEGRLDLLQQRMARQVQELGTAFRLPGEERERPWPVSAMPLLIGEDDWANIAAGVAQRAELLERLLDDIFGEQRLVAAGALPAALITGSRAYWRSQIGVKPPGGHRLHIYAADLGRDPSGEWRVLDDHVRAPVGAGYALENRLASTRLMGGLQTKLHVERLAPFFSAFREGLAAVCRRSDPRIGLLTPGRYNQSYAEQAHLARYLGLLLVEGNDLAVREDGLFVRTIEGLKRIDALWRRIDSRLLDPLAFDATSAIGVPGLMDAMAAGQAVIANAPGAGVVESTAIAAFLPKLAHRLMGENLLLPNIATWWCGQDGPRAQVEARLDELLIAPAFSEAPIGLPRGRPALAANLTDVERAALLADMHRRPMDYVAMEDVHLSTTPAVLDGQLVPRPFTVRVFAARDGEGRWTVMPGGFARIGDDSDARVTVMGEGAFSADVCVVGSRAVEPVSLLPQKVPIRRNPGTLPSRAADNLYWLGRYLERGEATLRLVRATLGGSIVADGGAALFPLTLDRLGTMLISSGAVASEPDEDEEDEDAPEHSYGATHDLREMALLALDGTGPASIATLMRYARNIASGTRDRLSGDVWRLVDAPLPKPLSDDPEAILARAVDLQERFSALAGLAAENMGRTAGWRFHDMGRRIERAMWGCRQVRSFGGADASADDLTTLLDLCDSQISYRARYLAGLAIEPVRDLVALDPYNPRSIAYQIERIAGHLKDLPALRDDGMAEVHEMIFYRIESAIRTATAETLDTTMMLGLENMLSEFSNALGTRFFLQGSEGFRMAGMTLA
ncbi:circularly permuted type 2 ATP-grasp protein [Rhizorhabdus sp.]|uniref:circularly permuted type 2 ATP-grasp protein n=1 Tax=Rhizorhabdus sp. TaxID=1968843 RepID=UPI0019A610C5|nr:circularly permuted type 2 ATP-grasp protein [Rhizorhabdus sp.]MBD3760187.1 circularly permuted type 2 ATP-grasp protein [Rhizorhabdus sp.]